LHGITSILRVYTNDKNQIKRLFFVGGFARANHNIHALYMILDLAQILHRISIFPKTSLPKKSVFPAFIALSSSRKENFDGTEFITFWSVG